MDKHLDTIIVATQWYLHKRQEFFTHVATKGTLRHDGREYTEKDLEDARIKKNEAVGAYKYMKNLKEWVGD